MNLQLELQRQQLLCDRQQFQRDQLKAAEVRSLQSPTLQPQTPLQLPPILRAPPPPHRSPPTVKSPKSSSASTAEDKHVNQGGDKPVESVEQDQSGDKPTEAVSPDDDKPAEPVSQDHKPVDTSTTELGSAQETTGEETKEEMQETEREGETELKEVSEGNLVHYFNQVLIVFVPLSLQSHLLLIYQQRKKEVVLK